MECYSDRITEDLTLCWSAQSSKTMTELCCMLFNMGVNQGNQIFLMPSEGMAKSFSETRLQTIINASPILKEKKPRDKNKFKILEMHMELGTVNLIGGASAANLASRSAGYLFLDEIDKLQTKLKDEADPISLLRERAKWFPNKKIFLTSTPTVESGHVWQHFLNGTQEYYYWPCPHCDEMFTPKWYKHVKFSQDKEGTSTFKDRAKEGYIECPHCEGKIVNKHKRQMLANGEWRADNPDASEGKRSFHLNEILSPITPLPKLIVKFLEAQYKAKRGDLGELQNFVNSSLAEPWRYEAANALTDEKIEGLIDLNRRRGQVPKHVHGLIAGVDTQDNGFYYVIRAFGEHKCSYLIAEGFVPDFATLEKVLFLAKYDGWQVGMSFIDSQGHRTDEVQAFCRKHIQRIIPCVGRPKSMGKVFSYVQVDQKRGGNKIIGGLQRIAWNTVAIKDQMFYRMSIKEGDPGEWRIHSEVDNFYKRALKSEFKNDKGDYEHKKHIENHLLDCEAMAYLGAEVTQIEYMIPKKPPNVIKNPQKKPKEDNYKW